MPYTSLMKFFIIIIIINDSIILLYTELLHLYKQKNYCDQQYDYDLKDVPYLCRTRCIIGASSVG